MDPVYMLATQQRGDEAWQFHHGPLSEERGSFKLTLAVSLLSMGICVGLFLLLVVVPSAGAAGGCGGG